MAKRVRLVSTAYGPPWGGIQGTGVTATGVDLRKNPRQYVVAVDPRIIPLGSKLKIPDNPFGDPNIVFTAADTGGAIKGNRLDFFDWRGRKTQMNWGTRPITASIVGSGNPSRPARAGATPAVPGTPGTPPSLVGGTSPSAFSDGSGADVASLIQALMSPTRAASAAWACRRRRSPPTRRCPAAIRSRPRVAGPPRSPTSAASSSRSCPRCAARAAGRPQPRPADPRHSRARRARRERPARASEERSAAVLSRGSDRTRRRTRPAAFPASPPSTTWRARERRWSRPSPARSSSCPAATRAMARRRDRTGRSAIGLRARKRRPHLLPDASRLAQRARRPDRAPGRGDRHRWQLREVRRAPTTSTWECTDAPASVAPAKVGT
jgi:3D (Asp-Asp-Asp) domain-containing protein